MKKIYSFVLMATMLLIGTNVWAQQTITLGLDGSGADHTTLQAAFDAVPAGGTATIKLISDNYTTNAQAWLGTKELAGTPKNITLDLNGKSYTYNGSEKVAIALTHGKLTVKNGSIETATAKEDLIRVYGTFQEIDAKTETPFSYFVLEESATLKSTKKNALVVDQLKAKADDQGKTWLCTTNDFDYATDLFATSATGTQHSRGLANGVKLEIKGTIDAKKYGIKVNGNVGYINDYLEEGTTFKSYLPQYSTGRLPESYAITSKSLDGACSPYVLIGPKAKIKTDATATEAVAVYAAGFGRWEIQGSCEGSTGLYAKSGSISVTDASIKSTNDNDVTVVPGKTSGVTAGGSAIVIESNVAYSGNTSITISGDSHIEGTSGYAIEETKKPGTPSDVEAITIEGGTIVGGEAGAIIVTEETATPSDNKVTVVGGDFAGLIQTVDDDGNKETGKVDDYIPATAEVHTTEVTVNGKTTIVISQGEDAPDVATSVISAANYTSVQWKNTSVTEETISKDSTILTELVIAEDYNQTLTVAAGKVLIVGRVVLGAKASIVVKPGAKFVVTSIDGISAHEAKNIKLESSESAQAEFIFHPGVTSNRQPMATVDMTVEHGTNAGEDVWTRFAIPVKSLSEPWAKKHGFGTWLYEWDYYANGGQGDWALVSGGSTGMKPWTGYTLSYNDDNEEVYTFTGNLLGNVDAALSFVHRGYNFFGNSYSGYVDAKTLLSGLADAHIDGTVYMWNAETQTYGAVTMSRLTTGKGIQAWERDIAPMQTFILQLRGADNAAESVNYASAIYSNPRHGNVKGAAPGAAAPSRMLANRAENASIYMVVTAANGKKDRIILTEGADFTDAFESGYDASKYMNEKNFNVYATINGENYSDVATNTLEGKTLSLQTRNEAAYTLSFESVEGAEYAIRDNVTGAVVAIEEGATYEFAAQPNSTIEGRFEIIGRNNAPTAIENTEVKANVKGIYSITGMYMGENFDVLPAGVYVVDGVKIIK